MSVIKSGAGTDLWTIDPTSKAGRITLYDANGLPLGTVTNPSKVDATITGSQVPIGARPDGFLRVLIDPITLLYDTFETIDTVNTWTLGGTIIPTGSLGLLSTSAGTAANGSSFAISKPAFAPGTSAYLQYAAIMAIDALAVTGNRRFWGFGVYGTPTFSIPIANGTIYEIDPLTGALNASVYSNSVRTQSVVITRPADGLLHRYAIYYKGSRVYFEIDNLAVASLPFPAPAVGLLSTVFGSLNGASAIGAAAVFNTTLIGVGDTSRASNKISDGRFPWRFVSVSAGGALSMSPTRDSARVRCSIVFQAVSPALADTLLSVQKVLAGVAAVAATSIGVTAGKVFRATSINFSVRAGAAAAINSTLTIRSNPAGATVLGSFSELRVDVGNTTALANVAASISVSIPEGLDFFATDTIGMSLLSSAVTNINSISVNGYEFIP